MNALGSLSFPTTCPRQFRPASVDPAASEAAQLMQDRHIPLDGHLAMQENLATYLSHRNFGQLTARWQNKVDRELKNPYSDEQVAARIDQLQKSLLENVQELPHLPSKIYVTGSFARGRLGGNSDLDGYAVLNPQDISKGFDSYEKRVEMQDEACLFPLASDRPGYNRANLMLVGGASVAVDPTRLEQPGYLQEVYQEVKAHRPSDRRETTAFSEWLGGAVWKEGKSAKSKRETFEGKTLKSRIWNAGWSLGGTLAGLPGVGAVVRWAANGLVKQHHRESF